MNTDEWLSSIGFADYAPAFQANNIGMDMLASLTSDELKEIGVESLGHRKQMLEAISKLCAVAQPTTDALPPEQPVALPPLEGGMWFNEEGSFITIGHSTEPNAPFFAISKFIERVAPYRPEIAKWVTRNYPKDRALLAKFWKDLGTVLMVFGPWYLVWRGFVYGNKPEADTISTSLRKVREGVDALNWPRNAPVSLTDVSTAETVETTWGQMLSRADGSSYD